MARSAVTVRPVATAAELDAFFRLAAATFVRQAPVAVAARDWRRYLLERPEADLGWSRGAFRDGVYLGGYVFEERWLRFGAGRVRSGWIGGVVTHPDHRRQGVATALMADALAYARSRGLGFLLLHGLANFYDRFGFVDVFDATEHAVERDRILDLAPSPCRVRPATVDDAAAMLDLYDRHYGPYPGSAVRTVEEQTFRLRFATSLMPDAYDLRDGPPFAPPLLAVGQDDRPRGYLIAPWGPLRAFGSEVAADDWPAALALLQHEARSLAALPDGAREVRWPLPPDSPTFFLLADHLPVRSQTSHQRRAGWMACPVDLGSVVPALVPAWQDRWRRRGAAWSGRLALGVDDQIWIIDLEPGRVRAVRSPGDWGWPGAEGPGSTDEVPPALSTGAIARRSVGEAMGEGAEGLAHEIRLTRHVFTQLLFGYRPADWTAAQPGQRVPRDLVPVLDALIPLGPAWIPPTDGC